MLLFQGEKKCWCCYGATVLPYLQKKAEDAVRTQRCSPHSVGPIYSSDEMPGECSNRCITNWRDREYQIREPLRGEAPRTGFMKPPGVRSLLDPNTCPEPPHSCCWFVPFTFSIRIPTISSYQKLKLLPWLRITMRIKKLKLTKVRLSDSKPNITTCTLSSAGLGRCH